jgi:hypothetical protein
MASILDKVLIYFPLGMLPSAPLLCFHLPYKAAKLPRSATPSAGTLVGMLPATGRGNFARLSELTNFPAQPHLRQGPLRVCLQRPVEGICHVSVWLSSAGENRHFLLLHFQRSQPPLMARPHRLLLLYFQRSQPPLLARPHRPLSEGSIMGDSAWAFFRRASQGGR